MHAGKFFGIARLLGAALLAISARATEWPEELAPFFGPPAEWAGQFGAYASPLRFYDGRPVASAAEWPARRAEILARWHALMGPWPERLAQPACEIVETETRPGVVQHRVSLEVAPGLRQTAFLLVPATGQGAAGERRPAVFVPFYAPEVSVGYDGPRPLAGQAKALLTTGERGRLRDFALQLARRGFVTLALGTPGDDAYRPALYGAACQPLSHLAYVAANAHTALAQRPEVDPARIGIMGHSYGGKWALVAACLDARWAAAVWSDPGVVFDETRKGVNYWEPWYLGRDAATERTPGLVSAANPRTGAYRALVAGGHDLQELHALMAPRPFLVSGGAEDGAARWAALNHAVAVNRFLGYELRVALTTRPTHAPTEESNAQAFRFLERALGLR